MHTRACIRTHPSTHTQLKNYADQQKILFTASGWDEESVDLLDEIGVPFFKVASADLTNFPLLEHTAKKGKPMIIRYSVFYI